MRIEDAIEEVQNHNDLLGKLVDGARIDELIIAPTNAESRQKFNRLYVDCLDPHMALLPFKDEDVEILAVLDKERIRKQSVIVFMTLDKILKRLST